MYELLDFDPQSSLVQIDNNNNNNNPWNERTQDEESLATKRVPSNQTKQKQ